MVHARASRQRDESAERVQRSQSAEDGDGGSPRDLREETLEDIKIFQEWLRESHETQTLSQRIHQGLFWVGLSVYCYYVSRTLLFFASAKEIGGMMGALRAVGPSVALSVLLCLFFTSGAYHRRIILPGTYTQRINASLRLLGISYCAHTSRLKILPPNQR
eukprot:Tamp_33298.p1 GENE.Tamp_33298~~Tamp_33298.p1  ORF type:complete len:175 (-),score=14.85 Tamp_33298:113-595(-)